MLLAGATVALLVLSVGVGSVWIPPDEVLRALVSGGDSVSATIVRTLRLPRALAALLAGAALGTAGLQMQTYFRNDLAGPYVLGLSAGASLGVALLVLGAGVLGLGAVGAWGLAAAAFLGAGAVLALVALAALRVSEGATLLIVGLMFASFTSAIVSVLQFFAEADRVQAFLFWTFGSLGGVTWAQLPVLAGGVGAGLLLGGLLVKPLDALLLGERYAESMGVSVARARALVFASTSLLAGTVTAFCGPIAFVGLAVPHLVRALTPQATHRVLVPATALGGAVVLLACDLVARLPGSGLSLPLNAVTSLVGAPVVVWVLLRRG